MQVVDTFVAIPFRGKLEMTNDLVKQLVDQHEYTQLLLFNNGPPEESYPFEGPDIEVFEAHNANIHKIWNVAVGYSVLKSSTKEVNVAILNNDIWVGPWFVETLAAKLRSDPRLAGVCGSDAPRHGYPTVEYSRCEEGFVGNGFMIKGELDNLPFDERYEWWYGETDWVVRMELAGYRVGTVKGAQMIHLDGGSVSVKEFAAEIDYYAGCQRDTARFYEKWDGYVPPGEKRIPEELMGSQRRHQDHYVDLKAVGAL